MKKKGITTNKPMKTQKKQIKMSDNFKFSSKQIQRQTRSLYAKRLGKLKHTSKLKRGRERKKPKPFNKRYDKYHTTI
jgi:hypothetical protein